MSSFSMTEKRVATTACTAGGAFVVAQECLPSMLNRKWGRIINITSIGGQWGGMRQVHYAAAKAGLINFTHSLARLYSGAGITANAILLGWIDTEMTAEAIARRGDELLVRVPSRLFGQPADIAEIAAP